MTKTDVLRAKRKADAQTAADAVPRTRDYTAERAQEAEAAFQRRQSVSGLTPAQRDRIEANRKKALQRQALVKVGCGTAKSVASGAVGVADAVQPVAPSPIEAVRQRMLARIRFRL